ncbi:MAG TPA: hemerythrin domain-containing protein [Ferrovibrio sp.]|uniref:hemerythrin domain-containing protein n=1 Tax=Ferrovibrio sp. TaxID=1917215 RepID=UPI002ED696C7
MHQATLTIRGEHRAFGAMLHALVAILDDLADRGGQPDFELLQAMLDYVDRFPDRYHHAKEDEYLFRLLAPRAPDARQLLDALETEHFHNGALMAGLRRSFERLRLNPRERKRLLLFRDLANRYARFHWNHMRLEEEQVLPLAEARLTEEDWAEIDVAFASNNDPLIGLEAKTHFDDLRRRIVNLAPAPIGLA